MSATINLTLEQIKELINQFDDKEKEELAKYLDKITLKRRFDKFISSRENIPISLDEITEEVEKVRSQRYK